MSVTVKAIKIISDNIKVPESDITLNAHLSDLGMDSLAAIELVMGLEEAFNITIPDQDLEGLQTAQDIINYINSK